MIGLLPAEDMEIDLEGETYFCSIYPSEVSSLRYGFLTARDAYYQNVRLFTRQLVIEVILYFAVAIVFSLVISRRTWSPVQNLVDFMKSRTSQIDDVHALDSLEQSIRSIADEKEILENQLALSRRRSQTLQLGLYLTGNSEDYSALSQYVEEEQPYRILMIWASDPGESEFFLNVPQNRFNETLRTLFLAMQNILEETLLDRSGGVSLQVNGSMAMILQTDESDEQLAARIGQALELTDTALSLRMNALVSRRSEALSEAAGIWNGLSRQHEVLSFLPGEQSGVLFAERFTAAAQQPAAGKNSLQKNSDFVRKVKDAIEQNFSDPSLNASMLASQMGMTLTNFCHKYKTASGQGILDEIHMTRLREAKKLLALGFSVREAAERTGYLDARAMNRAFKRYEDTTPSEYRQKNS